MTTSVAMCTYNGAKYIEEQLRSILNQTHPVDEIVVCDDGSTDDTLSVIESLQGSSRIPIRVYRNEPALGVRANFNKAIHLCKGEVIFLSDQDDIWVPNKVEVVSLYFSKHLGKNAVFTNASFIDDHGGRYAPGVDLFTTVGFSSMARLFFRLGFGLELFMKNNRATGATMAFRRDLVDYLEIGAWDKPYHDEILCLKSLDQGKLGFISDSLTQYRIHTNQTCGLGNLIENPVQSSNALSPLCGNTYCTTYLTSTSLLDRVYLSQDRNKLFECEDSRLTNFFALPYLKVYGSVGALFFVRDFLSFCKRKAIVK